MANSPSLEKERFKVALETNVEGVSIAVKISEDKLKVFIDCIKHPDVRDRPFLPESLLGVLTRVLADKLIQRGAIVNAISDLCAGRDVIHKCIARGKPAVNGRNGKVVLLVKMYDRRKNEGEPIDSRFIKRFDNIESGTTIGRIYPPVPGVPGEDVFGKPIAPTQGQAIPVQVDKTINVQEPTAITNFHTLVANAHGYLEEVAGKLCVKEELVIKHDLDYRVGDIDFIGSVKLGGSVMKGFQIKAGGNIEVSGDVVGGMLWSKNGCVTVKGCITSNITDRIQTSDRVSLSAIVNTSQNGPVLEQVRAAGAVRVGRIENSSIDAGGNIEIDKDARHSLLRTRTTLSMPNGRLVGGQAYVVCGMVVKTIGSKGGARTTIHLCSDVESSAQVYNLVSQIETLESAEKLVTLSLGPYVDNPWLMQKLAHDHRTKVSGLYDRLMCIRDRKISLAQERDNLMAATKYNSELRVNYQQTMHLGVQICVGQERFTPGSTLKGPGAVEFKLETKTFVVGGIRPIKCDFS